MPQFRHNSTTSCALAACGLPLEACSFYHLAKFLDHFLPIRLLLEACSRRLVSSPDDLPFIVMIGPKGLHCLDRIRSSPCSDFSWPWLAFVISKLIFIFLLLLTHHIIVASLWLDALAKQVRGNPLVCSHPLDPRTITSSSG